ncbi:MAG: hypothetical protein NTV21_15025 [Planctomycetota bacterium]|nr:hypothetical protein [Planctomycetota bacterium]
MGAGSALTFPHNGVMNTGTTATIEYWARAASPSVQGNIVWVRYADSAEHKVLTVFPNGSVDYLYAGSPWTQNGFATAPNVFPMDGQWHHVAFVRRADATWSLHVDGSQILSMGPGFCWGGNCGIIGTSTTTRIHSNGDSWELDEVRVSNVERYSATPFAPALRHTTDSSTVMLLHFDEGAGAVVHDDGIALQVGQTTGNCTWASNVAYCSTPIAYCTAGTTTNGCTPSMSAVGTPSAMAGSGFDLICSNSEGDRYGLILYGMAPTAVSWAINSTSLVCVAPPQRRTGAYSSGGALGTCTGTYTLDFNAFIASDPFALGSPFSAGRVFYAQAWFRDPGAPKGTNLSNGIQFTLCE